MRSKYRAESINIIMMYTHAMKINDGKEIEGCLNGNENCFCYDCEPFAPAVRTE